jgi:hypothetical protein
MSFLGFLLVLGAVALVAAWIVALPLNFAWNRWLCALAPARALRWARWNLVVLSAPLLGGLVVALAASGAFDFAHGWGCHCASEGLHLCPHHPDRALELLPFAALVLLLVAPRLIKYFKALRAARRLGRALRAEAAHAPRDGGVVLADLGRRNAFTAGGREPVIVADATWWQSLTDLERSIVRAHEEAHVRRQDPMTLAIARGLAAWLPPSADSLVRWWHAAAEHHADQWAARTVNDPFEVAAFLLRQERTRTSLLAFHGTALELRVTALVEAPNNTPHTDGDLDRTLSGALLLALAGVVFGAELHHLTERFIAWIS